MPKEQSAPASEGSGRRHLCDCALSCAKHWSVDPDDNNKRVKGLFLTARNYRKHQDAVYQAAQARREAAEIHATQAIYGQTFSNAPPADGFTTGNSSSGLDVEPGPSTNPGEPSALSEHGQDTPGVAAGPAEATTAPQTFDYLRPTPEEVALERNVHRLRELQRAWKEPTHLVFHGPFGSVTDGLGSCVPFLRHGDSPENYAYLYTRERAIHLRKEAAEYEVHSPTGERLKGEILTMIDQWIAEIEQVAMKQWQNERIRLQLYAHSGIDRVDTSSYFYDFGAMKLHRLCSMLTVLALYLLRGLTRSDTRFLLECIQLIVLQTIAAVSTAHGLEYTTLASGVTSGWEVDIRIVLNYFNLHPQTIAFAMCQRCNVLYPSDARHPHFRERCNHRGCNGLLFRRVVYDGSGSTTPLLTFNYQSPISWIGRLLARRTILDQLIKAPCPPSNPSDLVRDFWGGTAVMELLDTDGKTPFFPLTPRTDEIRLAFGLFIDWFSPFGTRTSRTYSTGAIYLVCMNLPIEIRYRVENICLIGVIPGPKETRLENLHHLLTPLVDDLLRLWSPGIILSHTAHHVEVLVRAALMPLIADSPALRKTVGLRSSSSANVPCGRCAIKSKQLVNFSWREWPRRTWAYHIEHATSWLFAPDENAREAIAVETGVRWSELLRLPYWDPTKYATVDAMHNLFLNDMLRHLELVWGMRWRPRGSAGASAGSSSGRRKAATAVVQTPARQAQKLAQAAEALTKSSAAGLSGCRNDYLIALAQHNGVRVHGFKKVIVAALLEWRRSSPSSNIRVPSAHPYDVMQFVLDDSPANETTVILDTEELEWIWPLASRVHLPSSYDRGPRQFGKAGQGHIKAAQWRTIGTVILPLVLIHQWAVDGPRYDRFREALLANFLNLVAAVILAAKRSTSEDRRQRILSHFEEYGLGLRDLVPNYNIPPSLHQSFHLPELLGAFGPTPGWWTFPFERYNGIMRRIPHNGRRGLLEMTFFWNFCRACNFRAVMERLEEASILPEFRRAFARVFGEQPFAYAGAPSPASEDDHTPDVPADVSGHQSGQPQSLTPAMLSSLAARLNRDLAHAAYVTSTDVGSGQAQIYPDVMPLSSFTKDEVQYAQAISSKTDCDIIARVGPSGDATAGRIHHLFTHTHSDLNNGLRTETFAVFMGFQPLTEAEAAQDPYRRYEDVDARSYHNQLLPPLIIRAEDVVGHFAGLLYDWNLPPADGSEAPKDKWARRTLLATISLAKD